jgi:thiol-disulfide isomerase/thioredoxin
VALVAVTAAAVAFPSVGARLGFASTRPTSYTVGERVDVPASVYESSRVTLLIFARSTCSACQSAKPAFAAIAMQVDAIPEAGVRVVTSSSGGRDERAYARDLGLTDTQFVTISFDGLRLKVVPTVILVDQRGVVRFTSEGVPSAAQRDELLAAARALASAR